MGASLIQPCRVKDEGFRIVNFCWEGRKGPEEGQMTVPPKQAPANSVPAAAVIRRVQTLLGITGRKALVGGLSSQM